MAYLLPRLDRRNLSYSGTAKIYVWPAIWTKAALCSVRMDKRKGSTMPPYNGGCATVF